ncbi:hypothetical protein IAD21_02335 [Abditibacteriota bacterium]|nr:hypothetical protein IAD21_02335 [Abditibacteriota bacterium]
MFLSMSERRSIGRRFIDLRPDAPIPLYPVELERRQHVRRDGDRPPIEGPRRRRRVPLLFCAVWKCAWCGEELRSQRNIAPGERRLIVVEPLDQLQCECHESQTLGAMTELEWKFQSGHES